MLKMLEIDKSKVPSLLLSAWQNVLNNFPDVFKKLFVTNALDSIQQTLL